MALDRCTLGTLRTQGSIPYQLRGSLCQSAVGGRCPGLSAEAAPGKAGGGERRPISSRVSGRLLVGPSALDVCDL